MTRPWNTEKELAELMLARANAKKRVVLTPDTAMFVGMKLMTVSEKPTREEIARILCKAKCETCCYLCIGTANEIVHAYGFRLPDWSPS